MRLPPFVSCSHFNGVSAGLRLCQLLHDQLLSRRAGSSPSRRPLQRRPRPVEERAEWCPALLRSSNTVHHGTHGHSAAGSRAWLARLPPGAADTLAAAACLDYAAGEFAAALDGFEAAAGAAGVRPDIAYGAAACHFRLSDLGAASQLAAGRHFVCVTYLGV